MTKTNKNPNQVLISGDGCLDGRGCVWKIDVGKLLANRDELVELNFETEPDVTISDATGAKLVAVGEKGIGYSGFGRSLEVFQFDGVDYLAVGLPLLGYGYLYNNYGKFTGAVEIYRL
ncbi:unnamed protein product [Ambrosiozyma monospora]|uniref:Unnamed protein product n=1 Tax=Ambrosiozyma monospora TaxID=43982 RepID=A0ACB5U8Y1_AMBMO|nr:unnamed protein product [Ambrosiozyma monospora]